MNYFEKVNKAILDLPSRYQKILDMRYGLSNNKPMVRQKIADYFGVTVVRIRQLEIKALEMISNRVNNYK